MNRWAGLVARVIALVLFAVLAGVSMTGQSGMGGIHVNFWLNNVDPPAYCESNMLMAGSGIVHMWVYDSPECRVLNNLHLVFKPQPQFTEPDCDGENLANIWDWHINPYLFTDIDEGDEGQFWDFFTPWAHNWICWYWT